jgi:hypothetical protein
MTKRDLSKKLKDFPYETRAKYVNRIKEDAEEQESWLLAQLELEDLIDDLNKELLVEKDGNRLAMIAARLQGVQMLNQRLFKAWSLK